MDKLTLLATATHTPNAMLLVPDLAGEIDNELACETRFCVWCLPCTMISLTYASGVWHNFKDGRKLLANEAVELFIVIDGSKYPDRKCFLCEKEVWACESTTV